MRNRRYIFLIGIIIFILFSNINGQGKVIEPIDDIIKLTNGSIEEVGIRLSFSIKEYGKEELEKILNKLNIKDIYSIEGSTDHGNYSLNFRGEEVRGTIVNIKDSTDSSIVLDITEKAAYNNVEEIKNNVVKSLKLSNNDIQYSYYIKAKLPSNDMSSINDNVLNFLRGNGSTNIESIDINNGYSTVAYTRQFKPINNNGKLIDLNYAVVTYSSGTYILLGTPIIMIPY